jgi:hypothetical protein
VSGARDIGLRLGVLAAMMTSVFGLTLLFETKQSTPLVVSAAGAKTVAGAAVFAMAANYQGEIDFGAPYSALSPLSDIDAIAAPSGFDPGDDYWGLPRSKGVEIVAGYCSACHSLALVMQQRQSREGWDELLNWMVEKQGMADPDPTTRAAILGYLSREFDRR